MIPSRIRLKNKTSLGKKSGNISGIKKKTKSAPTNANLKRLSALRHAMRHSARGKKYAIALYGKNIASF